MTARVTCGLAAPRDRSLTIIGDKGTIVVRDLWDNRSPIHLEAFGAKRPLQHRILDWVEWKVGRKLPLRLYAGTEGTLSCPGRGVAIARLSLEDRFRCAGLPPRPRRSLVGKRRTSPARPRAI